MKTKQTNWLLRLAAGMLAAGSLFLLGSCKQSTGTPDTTQAAEETGTSGEEDPLSRVPVKQLDRDFTILNAGWCNTWLDEEQPDSVASTRLAGFRLFEENYQTSVYTTGANASDVLQGLRNVQMTGDTSYDLVFPHPTVGLAGMMTEGYFANLLALEAMKLDGSGYNQSQVSNYTANGKLYLCAPDLTVDGQGFFALVYNREILSRYEFAPDYIREKVLDGDWTMETLTEMVKMTDTEGSTTTPESRTYGLIFNTLPIARWMYAMNERILTKNDDGTFVAGMESRKMVQIANALDRLLYSAPETVLTDSNNNSQLAAGTMYNTFKGKRGLFITWDIGSCYSYLRDLDFDQGYAPLPKYDSAQSDYRVICASGLMGIPAITTSVEESGMAMEFLAVYSALYLRPEFFRTIIGSRLSEYPEDYDMLNLLHAKKFYDLGYTMDEQEKMVLVLRQAVIDNRNPDSIATVIRSDAPLLNEIVRKANELN